MLDPWRLRLLTHLESLGTVRAVAEALDLSPSSVSQQLAVLQREARTVLLERRGRRVTLTPAGRRLAAHGREILARIELAEADLAQRRTDPVGPVRVAAFSSALRALVLPVLAALRREHPRLLVSTVEAEPHDALAALRRGEVDLALVYGFGDGGLPVDERIRTVAVCRDPVVLVLPRDHPVDTDGAVPLAALAGARWAMDRPGCHLTDVVVRACRRAGFEPEIAGRYSSYALVLEHVRAGAVAALPALAVEDRAGVAVRDLVPRLERTTMVALPAGPPPVAAVQVVLQRLRAAGASLRSSPMDDERAPEPDLEARDGVGTPDGFRRLWTPHRLAYIKEAGAEGCPFCRIPSLDDEDGLLVARGDTVYAVLNLHPYNPGHLMVVPYRHVAELEDLTGDESAELMAFTQRAVQVLKSVSAPHGFNVGLNLGHVAGGSLAEHLHQHVVPRWGGDANFIAVVGQTKVIPQLLGETRAVLADAWAAPG